jgi:hypothetical protein
MAGHACVRLVVRKFNHISQSRERQAMSVFGALKRGAIKSMLATFSSDTALIAGRMPEVV